MNEKADYFRWLATTYFYWTVVDQFPDNPESTRNRRRLVRSKANLIDAFAAYMKLINQLGEAAGTSWRRIVNENSINYGQWTLTTQQFGVLRTDSTAPYFFNNMTFLLLEAALAAVV